MLHAIKVLHFKFAYMPIFCPSQSMGISWSSQFLALFNESWWWVVSGGPHRVTLTDVLRGETLVEVHPSWKKKKTLNGMLFLLFSLPFIHLFFLLLRATAMSVWKLQLLPPQGLPEGEKDSAHDEWSLTVTPLELTQVRKIKGKVLNISKEKKDKDINAEGKTSLRVDLILCITGIISGTYNPDKAASLKRLYHTSLLLHPNV